MTILVVDVLDLADVDLNAVYGAETGPTVASWREGIVRRARAEHPYGT